MQTKGIVACLIFAAGWHIAQASTVTVPPYFSSTNCRVFGTKTANKTPIRMRLTLQGGSVPETTVAYWEASQGPDIAEATIRRDRRQPRPMILNVPASVAAMFDSTHFLDGGTVTVRFYASYSNGTSDAAAPGSAPVKNVTEIYSHPAFNVSGGDGCETVQLYVHNWAATRHEHGWPWTPAAYFTDMAGVSLVYIASHGAPDLHEAGNGVVIWPEDDYGSTPVTPGYLQRRQFEVGSGLPPYNSTHNPAIALLHMESCNTGDTNNFIRACWPYNNYYDQYLEDQAVLAPTVYVPIEQTQQRCNCLWGYLSYGYTVDDARSYLVAVSGAYNLIVWDYSPEGNPPGTPRTMNWSDYAIYGDLFMRVETVYTGTGTAPSTWYRQL